MTHPYIYAGLPESEKYFVMNGISVSNPKDIIDIVCEQLQFEREQLTGLSRKRPLVEARQIAIGLILISNPGIGLKKVGKMFNRDHSTIIYARENFNDLYNTNKQFTQKVNMVRLQTNNLN